MIQWLHPLVLMQIENLCPHENLHMDVYSSFIHNCQNLMQPRYPSVDKWINKLGTSRQQNIIPC